jgi:hypothetical protein
MATTVRSKPPAIRSETICSYRFAPSCVVVAAIAGRVPLLQYDPGVDREDAAPSHGASGEDPVQGIGV